MNLVRLNQILRNVWSHGAIAMAEMRMALDGIEFHWPDFADHRARPYDWRIDPQLDRPIPISEAAWIHRSTVNDFNRQLITNRIAQHDHARRL